MARRVDKWEANDGTIFDSFELAEQHEKNTNKEASFLFENYDDDEKCCESCGGITFDMCIQFIDILKRRFKFVDKNKKSK